MTLRDAKELAVKVLSKTLDMTKLTSEKGAACCKIYYVLEHVCSC